MIIPFKPQFKAPILEGTKIHTIREDKHRRWKKGRLIHMATGARSKEYNCFKTCECTGTQEVFMTYAYNDLIQISINQRELFGFNERLEFAKNDGFESWEDFFEWFYPLIVNSEEKFFKGRIIHWTDKRY